MTDVGEVEVARAAEERRRIAKQKRSTTKSLVLIDIWPEGASRLLLRAGGNGGGNRFGTTDGDDSICCCKFGEMSASGSICMSMNREELWLLSSTTRVSGSRHGRDEDAGVPIGTRCIFRADKV